jgi:WXG100 family type VII secretion target
MTDSGYMKIVFPEVESAITDLGRGVSTLDQKLGDLDKAARPLVATWEGAAQQAYNDRQVAWTKAATELKAVLTDIQKKMGESLAEYRATEDANTRRFR